MYKAGVLVSRLTASISDHPGAVTTTADRHRDARNPERDRAGSRKRWLGGPRRHPGLSYGAMSTVRLLTIPRAECGGLSGASWKLQNKA